MADPTLSPSGGAIIYLRQEGRGIGLGEKLKAYNLQDLGNDTYEANIMLRHPADARSYGLATAMLMDLGLDGDRGIRLLTNNPDKVHAVEGPNREVVVRERVAMIPLAWKTGGLQGIKSEEVEKYLSTKVSSHRIETFRDATLADDDTDRKVQAYVRSRIMAFRWLISHFSVSTAPDNVISTRRSTALTWGEEDRSAALKPLK
jgi:hypothetical protein